MHLRGSFCFVLICAKCDINQKATANTVCKTGNTEDVCSKPRKYSNSIWGPPYRALYLCMLFLNLFKLEFRITFWRVEISENIHLVHRGNDHEEKVPPEKCHAVLPIQFPSIQVSSSQ